MRQFKRSRDPQRVIIRFGAGVAGLLALAALTLGAVNAAWGMYQKFAEATRSDAQAKTQLTSLEAQEQRMSAAVAGLSTSRGLEAQLRQRYGVIKPGEGVIQIVNPAPSSTPPAAPRQSWWSRLWQAVMPW